MPITENRAEWHFTGIKHGNPERSNSLAYVAFSAWDITVWIHIIQTTNGNLFASLPSYKDGDNYSALVSLGGKEKQILASAIAFYEEQLAKQERSPKVQPASVDVDMPF